MTAGGSSGKTVGRSAVRPVTNTIMRPASHTGKKIADPSVTENAECIYTQENATVMSGR
jgi:hypothetical protein